MTDDKYKQWKELQDQFSDLSPHLNYNQEWKQNQRTLQDLLNGVDAIFLKLRDSQEDVITVEVGMGMTKMAESLMIYEELIKSHKNDLESMGGISEEDSLKLQITMDRRAKLIQTLSNILKKISRDRRTISFN